MIVINILNIFKILVFFYFGEKTSIRALFCCSIVTVGFFLGVQQEKVFEDKFTMSGVIFGVLSSFFSPLNSVYIKKSIKLVSNDLWLMNFWLNINAVVLAFPLIFIFDEHKKITTYNAIYYSFFWIILVISGILGFLVGYVTSLQIQVTSPLTHNISGTAKSYIQTLLGVIIYSEKKTLLWWISNFFVFAGAALYSYVRNEEMIVRFDAKQQQQLQQEASEKLLAGSSASISTSIDNKTSIEIQDEINNDQKTIINELKNES